METAAFCGTAAVCQSPGPRKIDPDKLFQMPDKFAQPAPDLDKLRPQPFEWNKLFPGRPSPLTPRPRRDAPQIDPKIILHPPWHGQSKGRDFAHHLYPNLKFLPLVRGPRMSR
jgi:hypothetical protein